MPDLDLIKQGKQVRCAAAAGAFVEASAEAGCLNTARFPAFAGRGWRRARWRGR